MHTPLYKATQPLLNKKRRWPLILAALSLVALAVVAAVLGTGFSNETPKNSQALLAANGPVSNNRDGINNIINSTPDNPTATAIPATPVPATAMAVPTVTPAPTQTPEPTATNVPKPVVPTEPVANTAAIV